MNEDISYELEKMYLLPSIFSSVIEYRGTVAKKYGIRLEIRTKEQGSDNIPHCHAYYQGQYISISLLDFSILESNLKFEQTKTAIAFVKSNAELLLATWKKYHGKYQTIV